jgi:alpha/beta superfamily hydrolase
MKQLLLLISFFYTTISFSQCGNRYVDSIFEVEKNTYVFGQNTTYDGTNQTLNLDLYTPKNDIESKRPCIIFCFGGSFVTGSRTSTELVQLAEFFTKKGYVCASIDYRLDNFLNLIAAESTTKAVWRAVQDAKAAIRYLRSKQTDFKIDEKQIFIGGTSAGAITAMTAGYSQFNDFPASLQTVINSLGGFEGSSNNLTLSSEVKGLFGFSGAILDTSHIRSKDLPVYLNHAVNDFTVPFRLGKPLGGASQIDIHGSYNIMLRIKNQQGYFVMDSFNTANHPSFVLGTMPLIAEFDTLKSHLNGFFYDLLDCNPNKKYSSSIAQITKNSTSSFYPNPVESEINFNFIAQKNIVEIYDMMGRKRLSEIVSDKKISIGDLPKGMYWIQINEEPPLKMMKK